MTDQVLSCLQCQGEVRFAASRRFVQCASCGTTFVIQRDESGQASLHLPALASGETVTADAAERAARLAPLILDAQEEVQLRQAEVDATTTAYWRGRLGLQRVIAGSQNLTYLSGLLSAVAAFLALFVLQSEERVYGAAIALLVALVAWALHREWRDEEKLGQADLAGSSAAVTEARAAFDSSVNRLADLTCEQSICVGFANGPLEASSK